MGTRTIVAVLIGLSMTAAFAAQDAKEADANNDGQISLSEFKAAHEMRLEERFARLDTNADGFISDDEMKAAKQDRKAKKGKRRQRGERNPDKIVERLDTDASGGVSFQELEGKRHSPDSETFYAADIDGNGELNGAELQDMMKAHRAARREARQDQ